MVFTVRSCFKNKWIFSTKGTYNFCSEKIMEKRTIYMRNKTQNMEPGFEFVMQSLQSMQETMTTATRELQTTLDEKLRVVEERLSKMEGRLLELEERSTVVEELGERTRQLETSVQRALQEVFPRVDSLLDQLEYRSSMSVTPSNPSSPEVTSISTTHPLVATPIVNPSQKCALGEKLCLAAREGRVKDVKNLIDQGADLNFCNSSTWTPLHEAVLYRRPGVITLLIANGACLEKKNKKGRTPLHIACFDGNEESVGMLLSAGANVDSVDIIGDTPLHYACAFGHEALVHKLIKAGANKNLENTNGKIPIDFANKISIRRVLESQDTI